MHLVQVVVGVVVVVGVALASWLLRFVVVSGWLQTSPTAGIPEQELIL